MHVIAHLRSPYVEKFGVPRQGNLVPHLRAQIVFTPEFRHREALRGLDCFSHLWIIWNFHLNGEQWSPTVRPPRLGGNTRMGVFATRSPFRPNGLGLSVLKIESIELDSPEGPIIEVSGADMVDGTPIYDIKPYIPYADSIEDAQGGFSQSGQCQPLSMRFDEGVILPASIDEDWLAALAETLAQDPRPAYQDDSNRVYHLMLRPYELSFRVEAGVAIILELGTIR